MHSNTSLRAALSWRGLCGFALLAAGMAFAGARQSAPAQPAPNPAWFNQMRYRPLGPLGNRADAVVGEPGNPEVVYLGAASGGVWKTTDGGVHWTPIFDREPAQSIGALALAPSNPNIVWAGTGEAFYNRVSTSIGDGIYKSEDGGRSWERMGLENTGRIARIIVDPANPDIVFAAAVGSGFAPSADRGVFRTLDGGRHWQRVLAIDDNTGASDISMDAHDSKTLLAGAWQLSISTWNEDSGGSSSGVYITHDGGDTWTRIEGHGLPTHPIGKVAVAIAPSDGRRMYALVQDRHPGFYRSDDGGANWRLVNQNDEIDERPPYYNRFTVDPADADRIYFISVGMTVSTDGGLTDRPLAGGGDNHDFWIDPRDSNRVMIADDSGASLSLNRGQSWQVVSLPIAQIYHVAADDAVPYFVYGNEQDNGSWRINNNPVGGFADARTELKVGGCETGFTLPADNNVIYSNCYDGGLDVFDLRTMQTRDIRVWPISSYGWKPADVRYRWNWTWPLALSPGNRHIVYAGSQFVHETNDGGASWKTISPDLTRNDKSHEQNSGGISYDNLMTFDGATLWSIAESPKAPGLIWAGSNDGLLHVTRDGGVHWTDVSGNIPGLPHWATISNIEPSHFDAATAYIAVDDHLQGDNDPLIYKTGDTGATWTAIGAGIPKSVFSYIACVAEDPVKRGLLYAADQNGVYASLDDGAHWMPLQSNLPHAPASWITVQPRFGDLLVSTYGRGIWVMDDIAPLRELTPAVQAEPAYLFTPRPAYRFRPEGGYGGGVGRGAGSPQPPPFGADINYFVRDGAPAPVATEAGGRGRGGAAAGGANIAILDAAGKTVATLSGPANGGVNRVWWDLRETATRYPLLMTSPPDTPWVPTPAQGRRLRTFDLNFSYNPPVAPPGTYRVRVSVAGETLEKPLVVLKDPRSAGTDADIQAQVALGLRIRDAQDELAGFIAQVEWLRHRLEALTGSPAPVAEAAKQLDATALAVERPMFDVYLTGAREDLFREPEGLWERLATLNLDVVDDSADFAPTRQDNAAFAALSGQLKDIQAAMDGLTHQDLDRFNQLLRSSALPALTVPAADSLPYAPAGRGGAAADDDEADDGSGQTL